MRQFKLCLELCFKQSLNPRVSRVNTKSMTTRRRLVVAVVSVIAALTPVHADAQVPDLVELSGQYTPPAPLADPQPAKAQVTSYDAALNAPIPLSERTFLIPGASYRADSVSFADTPPGFTPLRAFHAVDASLLFVQLLPHDWSLSLRLAGGLAGDFAAVDAGLLRVSGLAMATHSFGDTLVLGGGVIGSYAFGSFLPLPAAYVAYEPSKRFSVELFLPAFLQTKLRLWDRVELGYRAEVQGNAYAVRDARVADAWPCAAQPADVPSTPRDETRAAPSECFEHVAYSVVAAGPTVSVRLFATVWWSTFGGHTVFRRFDLMNGDDEPIPGGAQDLPNTWLVRSGLTWRIPME